MNNYINANDLFKQKQTLLDNIDIANKKYVCDLLKKEFSSHLWNVANSPMNAGQVYFSLKTNDLDFMPADQGGSLISNEFIRNNIQYFADYLNHEFKSFNYEITLFFLSFIECGKNCIKATYKPIEAIEATKLIKPSFLKSLLNKFIKFENTSNNYDGYDL